MSVFPSIPLLEAPSDAGVVDNASTGSEDEDIPEELEEEDPIEVVEPEPLTTDSIELDNYHILKDSPQDILRDNAHSTNVHRILTNISNGKQILVGPVLDRLAMALCGNAKATATILAYDHNYAYWKMKTQMDSPTIMELMVQCDKLVAFMETTLGDATITRLVDELEYDANTTDKPLRAWRLFWFSLLFGHDFAIKNQNIKSQILSHFDYPFMALPTTNLMNYTTNRQSQDASMTEFNVTLATLKEVGLKPVRTENIEDHLLIKGNEIKILKLGPVTALSLRDYHTNRIARSLGIHTLGKEILASLYILYVRDHQGEEAEKLEIAYPWTMEKFLTRDVYLGLDKIFVPHVLKSRVHALNTTITYRRKWLPSLIRDIHTSKREAPFVFWGSVLAIIFGVCSMLQTVMAAWSIVLAYKALQQQ